MTIFLEIAKKFLISALENLHENSINEDCGFLNRAATLCGYGRKPQVSEKKRALINEFIGTIKAFEPETSDLSDENILNSLIAMINEYKVRGANIANEALLPTEGAFGSGMLDLISAMGCIYSALKKNRLLNMPNDRQPMNIFLFYAGFYLACKANDTRIMGIMERIYKNPAISNSMELAMKKEQLLMAALSGCLADLRDYDPFSIEKRLVNLTISTLLQDNAKLCAEYASKVEIPVIISFLSLATFQFPTFRPGLGDLDECMNQAKIEIDQLMAPQLTEYHPESEPSASMAASSSSMAPHM